VKLRVPGRHNVLNALAALAIAMKLEIPFQKIAAALGEFGGVKRRFEIRWENKSTNQVIVDDYGHHPTEILATLAAARQIWSGRIVTVFQPHRYSRTLHCKQEFTQAFIDSDVVLITDIYAAGEEPIDGVSSQSLVDLLQKTSNKSDQVRYTGNLEQTRTEVLENFLPGDLVLCLGAGSITKLADQLSRSAASL
jgi:UDP-N-acetylmuramate--alanine ligase